MSENKKGIGTGGYFAPSENVIEVKGDFQPQHLNIEDIPLLKVVEGLGLKPVFGDKIQLSFVYMEPNSVAPVHSHPEEQIGTMIEGEYEFELNGVKKMIRKGDVYIVPPNVPHGAVTYDKGCIALDIFSPPRTGYKEMMGEALKNLETEVQEEK
ncbi:cupin domain-containing protein [Bacillus sp. FJAT-29790]|uniref:cupin domain-containing protein n=1 Tax=Bacillus sp. FJAT-29790 TaxID=1895002 RepID=UPI001C21CB1C|nr:cupin domain-containing protein [Bacillus sp. FJAT-29790]MBU8878351.1 cupin domain-containing protein [Bacillus sp. FJAT-29790]